jgi:hypothetical protein
MSTSNAATRSMNDASARRDLVEGCQERLDRARRGTVNEADFTAAENAIEREMRAGYVSPAARALIGRAAGEIVLAGDHEIEVLSID